MLICQICQIVGWERKWFNKKALNPIKFPFLKSIYIVISLSTSSFSLQIKKSGCGIKQKSVDFKYQQNYSFGILDFAEYYRFLFLDSGQQFHRTWYSWCCRAICHFFIYNCRHKVSIFLKCLIIYSWNLISQGSG